MHHISWRSNRPRLPCQCANTITTSSAHPYTFGHGDVRCGQAVATIAQHRRVPDGCSCMWIILTHTCHITRIHIFICTPAHHSHTSTTTVLLTAAIQYHSSCMHLNLNHDHTSHLAPVHHCLRHIHHNHNNPHSCHMLAVWPRFSHVYSQPLLMSCARNFAPRLASSTRNLHSSCAQRHRPYLTRLRVSLQPRSRASRTQHDGDPWARTTMRVSGCSACTARRKLFISYDLAPALSQMHLRVSFLMQNDAAHVAPDRLKTFEIVVILSCRECCVVLCCVLLWCVLMCCVVLCVCVCVCVCVYVCACVALERIM